MCGINGLYSNKHISNIEKKIISMNKSLLHRGPETQGYTIINKGITLGHNRLSIIDLSEASNQPFVSNSGKIKCIFNGEIYNFKEIKKELLSEYEFKTTGDTEVIVASIEIKGLDWFLKKANGIFAFAVYNEQSKNLTLVRDNMGVKPLYYSLYDGVLVFSSEIKGILSSGIVEPQFNKLAIDDYLANRYVREPYTFFHNINILESGCYLNIDLNLNIKKTNFWTIPNLNFQQKYNEKDILSELDFTMNNAIKLQTTSDVPVGYLLSGGLDSSLVVGMSKKYNPNMNTYSIGFQNEGYNELDYAQQVASQIQSTHYEVTTSEEEYIDQLESLTILKDSPLSVPNEIALFILSKEIKKHNKVVLSGEGADEIFFGYGRIFRAPFVFENREYKNNQSFYNYFIENYDYVSRETRNKLLTSDISYRDNFDKILIQDFKDYSNEENVFRFFMNYHIKSLLIRVDYTTMLNSIESRVPFLDIDLIKFACEEIPYNLKLHFNSDKSLQLSKTLPEHSISEIHDTPKYILKQLAYQYIDKNIIERKKMGFPVPLAKWKNNLKKLSNEKLLHRTWLSKYDENLFNYIIQSKNGYQTLWMLISLAIFEDNFFNKTYRW